MQQQGLAAVLVDSDDEEPLLVGECEPISLDGLKCLDHMMLEPRDHDGQPAPAGALWRHVHNGATKKEIWKSTPLEAIKRCCLPSGPGLLNPTILDCENPLTTCSPG